MSRQRVLIVENDVTARLDIVEILRDQGYVVEQAGNGREALDVLRKAALPPAVILLDLRTPVMNGWEFVSEQRGDAALAGIPVVLMSGDPDIARVARSLEAASYLRKPFGLTSLLSALSDCGAAP
jgi:CheY-like chemotaxis protein